MKKYILAIDQGTTSTRAILFDNMQNVVKTAQKEVKVYFPEVSWVVQDAKQDTLPYFVSYNFDANV